MVKKKRNVSCEIERSHGAAEERREKGAVIQRWKKVRERRVLEKENRQRRKGEERERKGLF
jgi:hypothetical protein